MGASAKIINNDRKSLAHSCRRLNRSQAAKIAGRRPQRNTVQISIRTFAVYRCIVPVILIMVTNPGKYSSFPPIQCYFTECARSISLALDLLSLCQKPLIKYSLFAVPKPVCMDISCLFTNLFWHKVFPV